MKGTARRKYIEDAIVARKKVEIKELSAELQVSEMTIRRDIKLLEEQGVLRRTFKGAELDSLKQHDVIDDSLQRRRLEHIAEKDAIARLAADYVADGDIIGLDASTTVHEMCKYLVDKRITIVTNSIQVSIFFNTIENINVVLTGGLLRNGTLSLIGADTLRSFRQYNTNKIFISAKALSKEHELTDINLFEIETKQAMIDNTAAVFVLLDQSKLQKTSLIKVCGLAQVSTLVVDGLTPATPEVTDILEYARQSGVQVLVAGGAAEA